MAKLGEGDKRWIVEDRKDGANVNAWHWTERDDTKWAKEAFKSVICGKALDEAGLLTFAKDIDHWEGDVLFFNRKGKQTVVYNLEIRMKWKGYIVDGEGTQLAKGSGKVSIYELSEEALDEGLDLTVEINRDKATGAADALFATVKREAARVLASQGAAFHELLKARLAEINGGPPAIIPESAAAAKPEPGPEPAALSEEEAAIVRQAEEDELAKEKAAAKAAAEAETSRTAALGAAYHDAVSGALNARATDGVPQEWDLSGQRITDVEMAAIVKAVLAAEPPLSSLNLARNALTDSGLQAICIALGQGGAPKLMQLDFRDNPAVTAAGRNMFKGLRALRGDGFEAMFE